MPVGFRFFLFPPLLRRQEKEKTHSFFFPCGAVRNLARSDRLARFFFFFSFLLREPVRFYRDLFFLPFWLRHQVEGDTPWFPFLFSPKADRPGKTGPNALLFGCARLRCSIAFFFQCWRMSHAKLNFSYIVMWTSQPLLGACPHRKRKRTLYPFLFFPGFINAQTSTALFPFSPPFSWKIAV